MSAFLLMNIYHPNIVNVARIIAIVFPDGPVLGTAGITVLVVAASGDGTLNFISSHPSSGINHTLCSHDHCLEKVNISSLIFTVPKCNHSCVFGFNKLISTFHQFELFVQNIVTSFQFVVYDWFNIVGFSAKEYHTSANKATHKLIKNFFITGEINKT